MRKSMKWFVVILLALLVIGLACSLGGEEEPTPTPVPPTATPIPPSPTPEPEPVEEAQPTETPEPTQPPEPTTPPEPTEDAAEDAAVGGWVDEESGVYGVRLSHPEEWFYDDSLFIILSSAADAGPMLGADPQDLPEGVIIFIVAGPAEDMEMGDAPPDEIFQELVEEFGGSADAEILDGPKEVTINDASVMMIEFRASQDEQVVHGMAAIFNNSEQAAVAIALWSNAGKSSDSGGAPAR